MSDTNYNNYPHRVSIGQEGDLVDIDLFDWLEDHVGQYYSEWNYSGYDFMFKSERDATLFALRWA